MTTNNIEVVVQQAVTTSQVGLVAAGIAAGATIIVALINIYISLKIKDIEKITKEHEIRFSKLHEKRAEVIEELYKKLVVMDKYAQKYFRPGNGASSELKDEATNKIEDFSDFCRENRIFFGDSIIEILSKIIDEYDRARFFSTISDQPIVINKKSLNDISDIQEYDKLNEIFWKNFNENISNLKRLIEQEFRELLGVK